MKTQGKGRETRSGAALLTVLSILFVGSALAATMVSSSMQRSYMANKLADRVRAVAIAEAGIEHAYSILVTNFAARADAGAFPPTSYAGGSYDVTVTAVGTDVAILCSTGACGLATASAILDVKNYGGSSSGSSAGASGYTVLAGGEITWTGASKLLGAGVMHSNGQFTRKGSGYIEGDVYSSVGFNTTGNSGGITGDVTAPEVTGKTGKISGTITETEVPLVTIPQIDLTPYYTEALANGEVYTGSQTLSSSFNPNGGIMWVNGDLHISGNASFTGCFIATGSIHISGNGSLTSTSTYPCLISRDGDMQISGAKTLTGLVYVKTGNYQQTGCNTLTGQIIVNGNVKKSGCSAILNYTDSTPEPPGGATSSGDTIAVSAWQK